jgi:uncharacterized protein (DUF305 family)
MKSNRVTVAAMASLLVGLLAACTVNIGSPAAPSSEQGDLAYSANDVMFAQMMIPHHEQAVELSDLALEVSTSRAVRDLAMRIRDGQAPEIDTMQGWVDAEGVGSMMEGHSMEGHGMAGIVSERDFERLRSLESPDFDQLFLDLMIGHHEGALDMVMMISGAENPEVAALAEAIVEAQTAEIAEMEALLRSL